MDLSYELEVGKIKLEMPNFDEKYMENENLVSTYCIYIKSFLSNISYFVSRHFYLKL